VTERRGRILVLDRGAFRREPLLDIRSLVESGGQEQGLLSVAFAPRDPRTFYVNYTSRRGGGDTVVARYRIGDAAAASGLVADPAPVRVLLTIDQPASNHNGGQLQFGPDGFLYVGMGDGGIAHDPWNNAERLDVLLGKMLRLDVSGDGAYRIPPNNPFVARRGARPEIWAYGLRNPWRFSFDRVTGDLYIGDVGQNAWEEIDVAPRSSRGGEHYGWDRLEGVHCHEPAGGCDPRGTTLPAVTYGRDGGCSVTGGYVYRGARIEALRGTYVFGDYCTGKIWGMRRNPSATSSASAPWQRTELLDTDILLASFGEDEAGELYLLDLRGGVYRLDTAGE